MIELATVNEDDVVNEPGCGDARIVIAAVQREPRRTRCRHRSDLAEVCYARVKAAGLEDKIEIYWGNALDLDMSGVTVRVPLHGKRLQHRDATLLWEQLPSGARVVSNDFHMGTGSRTRRLTWKPPTEPMSSTCGRSRRRSKRNRPGGSRTKRQTSGFPPPFDLARRRSPPAPALNGSSVCQVPRRSKPECLHPPGNVPTRHASQRCTHGDHGTGRNGEEVGNNAANSYTLCHAELCLSSAPTRR